MNAGVFCASDSPYSTEYNYPNSPSVSACTHQQWGNTNGDTDWWLTGARSHSKANKPTGHSLCWVAAGLKTKAMDDSAEAARWGHVKAHVGEGFFMSCCYCVIQSKPDCWIYKLDMSDRRKTSSGSERQEQREARTDKEKRFFDILWYLNVLLQSPPFPTGPSLYWYFQNLWVTCQSFMY